MDHAAVAAVAAVASSSEGEAAKRSVLQYTPPAASSVPTQQRQHRFDVCWLLLAVGFVAGDSHELLQHDRL